MAENYPVIRNKEKAQKEEVTPEWDKVLYAPERVEKWLRGEITLQELNAISGPEMLEMAVIGFSMYEQGRYEEAKVIFQGLCTLDPKEGYYRTALGAVYLAQGSLRSAALALAAGVSERVGFATSAGRALYSRTIPYRKDLHHAARLWQLGAAGTEPTPAQIQPRLYPGAREEAAVDALLASAPDARPLVALAPGSVWATKRWPYYAELARELAGEARLVVAGSEDDRSLAAAIVAAAGPGTIDACGALSLLASAALIGRCRALVTNDSAPQHLASAMGTPTLTIFGPTVPAFGSGAA